MDLFLVHFFKGQLLKLYFTLFFISDPRVLWSIIDRRIWTLLVWEKDAVHLWALPYMVLSAGPPLPSFWAWLTLAKSSSPQSDLTFSWNLPWPKFCSYRLLLPELCISVPLYNAIIWKLFLLLLLDCELLKNRGQCFFSFFPSSSAHGSFSRSNVGEISSSDPVHFNQRVFVIWWEAGHWEREGNPTSHSCLFLPEFLGKLDLVSLFGSIAFQTLTYQFSNFCEEQHAKRVSRQVGNR